MSSHPAMDSDQPRGSGLIDRVLVVDQPASAEYIKAIFTRHGFKVSVAKDGGQAHASFTVQKPDFVILELLLPGESGYEICERLKKLNKAVPVLALSEIDLDASRNLAARVGVDGYLTKPFDETMLLNLMQGVNDAVWERNHCENVKEKGVIRFHCRCGTRLTMHLKDKGKAMYCSGCKERVDVPEWVGSRRAEFFIPRGTEEQGAGTSEPLEFVIIRCQHCSTYYRLMPQSLRHARTCSKCGKKQEGSLNIVGLPMSKAALASSRRVLIIRSGKNRGKKLLLPDTEVVIGRSPTCHLRSTSQKVSRRHCLLKVTPHGLLVHDLQSQWGTYINDERIEGERELLPGDSLRVGPMQWQLAGRHNGDDPATGQDLAWFNEEIGSDPKVPAEIRQEEFDSTAEEAAHIFRLHWDLIRREARKAAIEEVSVP